MNKSLINRLKKIFTAILLVSAISSVSITDISAQSYAYSWHSHLAGSGNVKIADVEYNDNGLVYVTGNFTGTVDLAPGPSQSLYSSNGLTDFFIAVYDDSDGTLQAALSYGSTGDDNVETLELLNDQVYIAGYFNLVVEGLSISSNGGADGFVAWFDRELTGPLGRIQVAGDKFDVVKDIAVDTKGTIYTTGTFTAGADFDVLNNRFIVEGQGGQDVFWAAYDNSGALIWARSTGDPNAQNGKAIELHSDGNLYMVAQAAGTVERELANGVRAVGGQDILVMIAEIESGGILDNFMFGGEGSDFAEDIEISDEGIIHIAGNHNAEINFNAVGGSDLSSANNLDGFISRYTNKAQLLGFVKLSGLSDNFVEDIAVDNSGNIYATGYFSGVVDLDNEGSKSLESFGGTDMFATAYDPDFGLINFFQRGGVGSDYGDFITLNGQDIYFGGRFSDEFEVDPANKIGIASEKALDAVMMRYSVLATQPIAQPTNLNFSNIGVNSFSASFSAPVSTPSGYIAIVRRGAQTTDTPKDGQSYSVGQSIGSSTVFYSGSLTSFSRSSLLAESQYYVKIYAYNGSGFRRNYRLLSPLSGSVFTLSSEPTASPTSLLFSNRSSSGYDLSFTAASGAPAGYLIVRAQGAAPNTAPADGTAYTVGASIGNATVVENSNAVSISETGLTAGTTYQYAIYSYNGNSNTVNYKTVSPLTGSFSTLSVEPTAAPSNLTFGGRTPSSIDISFDAASGAPSGYLVLRKAGSAPTGTPVDGTSYTVGSTLGDATVVKSGAGTTVTDNGLAAQTQYFYTVFSFNGTGGFANYYTTTSLSESSFTLSSEPTAQPSGLNFSNITSTTMDLSWSAASPTPSGYIVVSKIGSAPASTPGDGVGYVVNDVIGDGKVEYIGAGTSVSLSGLSAGTDYFFAIYSYNGSGSTYNYLATVPLQGSQSTSGSIVLPSAQPTNILFSDRSSTGFVVSFTAATGAPAGYIAIRRTGAAPTGTPANGSSYTVGQTIGDGTVAFVGSGTSFIESSLSANSTYFYEIYSFNGSGGSTLYLATNPLAGNETTFATKPLAQPTNLQFTAQTSTSTTLTFTASGSASSYLILRKVGSSPTGAPVNGITYTQGNTLGDATIVFVGSGTSVPQTGLTPGVNYFYSVFAFNGASNTSNYLSSGPLTGNVTLVTSQPGSQPTNLNFSNVVSTSFDLSYNAAAGSPDGYIGIIKKDGFATSTPQDGVVYAVDGNVGDGKVAFVTTGSTASITGQQAASDYYLSVYSYNGSGEGINYNETSPLQGSVATFAEEPPAQPSSPFFLNVEALQLTVSFSQPNPAASGYLVIRRASAVPNGVPADGTEYAIGDLIGDSYVAYSGPDNTFLDTLLTDGTTYIYKFFSYNGTGTFTNYQTNAPLIDSEQTLTVSPPVGQPSGLAFSNLSGNGFTVSFTATTAEGYIALRKEGVNPISTNPNSGIVYNVGDIVGDAEVAYVGNSTSFDETSLTNNTTYQYEIFAYNGESVSVKYNTNSPLSGSISTLADEPLTFPSDLIFGSVDSGSMLADFTGSDATSYIVVRGEGSEPTFVPQDGVSYTNGSTQGSDVVSVGTTTSYGQSALLPETEYFYTVYGFNGTAGSSNYNTNSVLSGSKFTLAEEPGVVEFLEIPDVTLFASSLTINYNAAIGADYYVIIRNDGASTNDPPVNAIEYNAGDFLGTGEIVYKGTETTFIDTGLSPLTEYNYVVYAVAGTVESTHYSPGSSTGSVTTKFGDTSPPELSTNNTPTSVTSTSSALVSVVITDAETSIASVQIETRSIGNGNDWSTPTDMTDAGGGEYTFNISSTSIGDLGVEYRVTATNTVNLSNVFGGFTISIVSNSPQFSYNSGGAGIENYRIISIPYELEDKSVSSVFSSLGAYDPTKYRLYRYENGSNRELRSGSVEVGNGYWFISRSNITINPGKGTTVEVGQDTPFTFALKQGWNQIGNPYPFPIDWASILLENGEPPEVGQFYLYRSGFSDNSLIIPAFEGAFVFTSADVDIQLVPDRSTIGGRIGSDKQQLRNALGSDHWEVPLKLVNESFINQVGGFGMSIDAKEDRDGKDGVNAPRFIEYMEINHGEEFMGYSIAKDMVPNSDSHTWSFSVDDNTGANELKLEWDNSYFGNGEEELVLWDITNNKIIDMRVSNSYTFSNFENNEFKVLYGARSYVNGELIPESAGFTQVYPNPFRNELNIQFAVPETENGYTSTTVEVYNMMGVKVKTLLKEDLSAGAHLVKWNGIGDGNVELAQGTYIIRLSTGLNSMYKRVMIQR